DDVADYGPFSGGGYDDSHNSDYEMLGDRLFETSGWRGGTTGTDDSIHYGTLAGGGWQEFCSSSRNAAGVNIADSPELAVGMVDGTDYGSPGLHYAIWTIADGELYLFIDLDDNGSANDVGEQHLAWDDDGANEPSVWRDIELITDAQGKMVIVGVGLDRAGGDRIIFLPLDDNGVYDNTDVAYIAGGTDWDMGNVRHFEIQLIPEPATMLLLGTGILGAIGYIRRRRMT
ncbi:MAG TPA: PEP-CTERM sorting domain-containing protein, partial [Planctomycetota bacterium]|nr:PEP-CTERM sorting domain-containing protein [Planctomycetota bacterium]